MSSTGRNGTLRYWRPSLSLLAGLAGIAAAALPLASHFGWPSGRQLKVAACEGLKAKGEASRGC